MDAQSRGRADDVDPADQWVLNPQTGNYELRLEQSPAQSPRSAPPQGSRTSTPSDVPGARAPGSRGA
ncbi:LCP family protein, partial [Streptomyces sp. NPDC055078]